MIKSKKELGIVFTLALYVSVVDGWLVVALLFFSGQTPEISMQMCVLVTQT